MIHTLLVVLASLALTLPCAEARSRLKKPRRGFQVRVETYTIAPGEDNEVCEYRRLPNKKPIEVAGLDLRMPPGAHHFVLWKYGGNLKDGDNPAFDQKFDERTIVPRVGCTGAAPDEFLSINTFGMQTPNSRVLFPKGIAITFDAYQRVFLNPHMKNFSTEPLVPDVRFNILTVPKRRVKHHAESFTVGNMPDINIPAGGFQRLVSEWTVPQDLNMTQLSSHQHRLGTYTEIQVEQDDGSMAPVFQNDDWEHPRAIWMHKTAPWKDRDPQVLTLKKGQKIRFTCEWQNFTAARVRFGTETTDEMCFVTGYFWRENEGEPLAGPGCFPNHEGLLCPFAKTVSSTTIP
jgi:hypothetical protein